MLAKTAHADGPPMKKEIVNPAPENVLVLSVFFDKIIIRKYTSER
jgi:hypothetical protein